MSTSEDESLRMAAKRPNKLDLQEAIHGLYGIFWALNMLVVQKAADEITLKEYRENGIASLITAGECLAEQLTERF